MKTNIKSLAIAAAMLFAFSALGVTASLAKSPSHRSSERHSTMGSTWNDFGFQTDDTNPGSRTMRSYGSTRDWRTGLPASGPNGNQLERY